jgi:hypothetical protein
MPFFIKSSTSGNWPKVKKFFVKTDTYGVWPTVKRAFVKSDSGWSQFWPKAGPQIDFPLEISSNSTDYPATLTGKNYHWDTGTTLTSKFERAPSLNGPWEDVTSFEFIANPAIGSSNIKTLLLLESHFILNRSSTFFRFVVKGLNPNNNAVNTEASDPIEIFVTTPIMTKGQVSSTSTTITIPFTANAALKYYIVEAYDDLGLVSSTRVNTPSSPVIVENLTPNTIYDIVIFPYNFVNTVGMQVFALDVLTAAGPPAAPTVIASSTTNQWSLDITFANNTTSVVIDYGISTSYGNTGTRTSSGVFSPVGPFASDTLYYYRVTPFNGTEAGTAVTGSIRTQVLVTAPGKARNVSIANVVGRNYNEGQALISWLPPLNNGGATVDYYRVQYAYDDDTSTWYTLSDTWTESPMHAGPFSAGYTIRAKVFAHNSAGYSESEVSPPPGAYINTKAEPLDLLTATRQFSTSISTTFTTGAAYGGSKGDG